MPARSSGVGPGPPAEADLLHGAREQPGFHHGGDGVAGHAVPSQVPGHAAGEADDALRGGGVVGAADLAQPRVGGHVHYAPAAPLAKQDGGELGGGEGPLEVVSG